MPEIEHKTHSEELESWSASATLRLCHRSWPLSPVEAKVEVSADRENDHPTGRVLIAVSATEIAARIGDVPVARILIGDEPVRPAGGLTVERLQVDGRGMASVSTKMSVPATWLRDVIWRPNVTLEVMSVGRAHVDEALRQTILAVIAKASAGEGGQA